MKLLFRISVLFAVEKKKYLREKKKSERIRSVSDNIAKNDNFPSHSFESLRLSQRTKKDIPKIIFKLFNVFFSSILRWLPFLFEYQYYGKNNHFTKSSRVFNRLTKYTREKFRSFRTKKKTKHIIRRTHSFHMAIGNSCTVQISRLPLAKFSNYQQAHFWLCWLFRSSKSTMTKGCFSFSFEQITKDVWLAFFSSLLLSPHSFYLFQMFSIMRW